MMKHFVKYLVALMVFSLVLGAGVFSAASAEEPVVIEFMQWWQPEMAGDSFDRMIQQFEDDNPHITVNIVTLPYSEVRDQIMIQAAAGVLPDVVGLDPQWIVTMVDYGVIANLDAFMERDNIDASRLALKTVEDSAWMLPVTSYPYPLYYNIDHLEAAGLEGPPETREEFIEYVKALTDPDQGQYGWSVPFDMALPNGVSNDLGPWVWAAGYDIMKDGWPWLNHEGMIDALAFVNELHQGGYISPGAMTRKEPEKVEEFATGRASMIISPIAHINMLRERNPDLNFGLAPVPGPADYDGPITSRVASWDVGISAVSSESKQEAAWQLIKFLTSVEGNSFIASNANAFPGNLDAEPDFLVGDPLFERAFEIFSQADLYYPLVGAPDAVELERIFIENIHGMLENRLTPEEVVERTEARWNQVFEEFYN